MLGKTEKNPQLCLGEVPLIHFIDPGHGLCLLAKKINWEELESEFAPYYSIKGAPSTPLRPMIGLYLLKKVFRFSDKSALEQWQQNPYWQYFCGEVYFQHKPPFHHGDFSHFRKRVGTDGELKINRLGLDVFGKTHARVFSSTGKKGTPATYTGFLSRTLNRLGFYLIKITSY